MLVKELYNLWIIEIKKGNRILAYKNYPTGIVAEYTYKGTFNSIKMFLLHDILNFATDTEEKDSKDITDLL